MNRKAKIWLLLLAASVLILAAALYASRDTIHGFLRQKKDEQAAEAFLTEYSAVVKEGSDRKETRSIEDTESETKTGTKNETDSVSRPGEIVDENYYERNGVTYTPDFARGTLDCVLEIPSISLKRGVYTGSQEEIEYDLDIWLTTAASPNLRLGETHYAIYGHNHPVQDLSFNRLKDVKPGDIFTLTDENKVWSYKVTNILAEWRNVGRRKYATNPDVDPSLCYIFTCGRDHWLLNGKSTRYKDYIIEGTLIDPDENHWDSSEEESPEEKQMVEMKRLLRPAEIDIVENGMSEDGLLITVTLKDENGTAIQGATLSLLNADGNEILSWQQLRRPKQLALPEGTYVVAVTELSDGCHEEPDGVEITVRSSGTRIVKIGEETEEKAVPNSELFLGIALASGLLAMLFLCLFISSVIRGRHKGNHLQGKDQP